MTSGNIARAISGLKNFSLIVAQSAARTIATRISARTAYCTPREIRARLRGLMPMAALLSVPGQPRVVGFLRVGKYFSKSLS